MANVFMSYAHKTRRTVRTIVNTLEIQGWRVWWDQRLKGGDSFAMAINRELAEAEHVVVAWSEPATRSVWVRGEALEALDSGKLVQIRLDKSRLPVPFNAVHAISFRGWNGDVNAPAWRSLAQSLGRQGGAPMKRRKGKRRKQPSPMQMVESITGASSAATIISLASAAVEIPTIAAGVAGWMPAKFYIAVTSFVLTAGFAALAISTLRMMRTDTSMPRVKS